MLTMTMDTWSTSTYKYNKDTFFLNITFVCPQVDKIGQEESHPRAILVTLKEYEEEEEELLSCTLFPRADPMDDINFANYSIGTGKLDYDSHGI